MPIMSRHLDEDDEDILPARRTAEREMTLGTGAILGIFFGLVLLLGAFFGFGYKLGSSTAKSAGAPQSAEGSAPVTAAAASPVVGTKPPAGSFASAPEGSAPGIVVRGGGTPVLTAPTGGPAPAHASQPQSSSAILGDAPAEPPSVSTHNAFAPATPALSNSSSVSGSGPFVVQVAAVSHQEDADLLVSALHSRGYAVAARSEPGDKLVHIQVGPFSNKHDADAMKQRLLVDGYNAFIK